MHANTSTTGQLKKVFLVACLKEVKIVQYSHHHAIASLLTQPIVHQLSAATALWPQRAQIRFLI